MKNKILSAIALETIYSYKAIETIYEETKSYDTTIELCNVCSLGNVSISEILAVLRTYGKVNYIDKLAIAGLSGAEAGEKLRKVLEELNENSKEKDNELLIHEKLRKANQKNNSIIAEVIISKKRSQKCIMTAEEIEKYLNR